MVIDTSALLAVLFDEPEAARIARSLASDPRRLACAFTFSRQQLSWKRAKVKQAGGSSIS